LILFFSIPVLFPPSFPSLSLPTFFPPPPKFLCASAFLFFLFSFRGLCSCSRPPFFPFERGSLRSFDFSPCPYFPLCFLVSAPPCPFLVSAPLPFPLSSLFFSSFLFLFPQFHPKGIEEELVEGYFFLVSRAFSCLFRPLSFLLLFFLPVLITNE